MLYVDDNGMYVDESGNRTYQETDDSVSVYDPTTELSSLMSPNAKVQQLNPVSHSQPEAAKTYPLGSNPVGMQRANMSVPGVQQNVQQAVNPYAVPKYEKPNIFMQLLGGRLKAKTGVNPFSNDQEYINKIAPQRNTLVNDFASGKIDRPTFAKNALNFPTLKEKGLSMLTEKPTSGNKALTMEQIRARGQKDPEWRKQYINTLREVSGAKQAPSVNTNASHRYALANGDPVGSANYKARYEKHAMKKSGQTINVGGTNENPINRLATAQEIKDRLGDNADPGIKYVVDKQGNVVAPFKKTEAQQKVETAYGMLKSAQQNLTDVRDLYPEFNPASLQSSFFNKMKSVGGDSATMQTFIGSLQSEPEKMYASAMMEFIAASRFQLSGQAVPATEVSRDVDTYFPAYNDSPAVQAMKKSMRVARLKTVESVMSMSLSPQEKAARLRSTANADWKKMVMEKRKLDRKTSATQGGQTSGGTFGSKGESKEAFMARMAKQRQGQ